MALASFCSDLTMPISWNACVEIGKQYTATVAATMNMLGNFAGFVAPTLTGYILDRFGNDWNFAALSDGGRGGGLGKLLAAVRSGEPGRPGLNAKGAIRES